MTSWGAVAMGGWVRWGVGVAALGVAVVAMGNGGDEGGD